MKLQTKLYLFFAGIVVFPLLVITVVASIVMDRVVEANYQTTLRNSLGNALTSVTQQEIDLAAELPYALEAQGPALLSNDSRLRQAALAAVQRQLRLPLVSLEDAQGGLIESVGVAGEAPLLVSRVQLNDPGSGMALRVAAFRPLKLAIISGLFELEGLEWSLLERDTVVAGSLPRGAQLVVKERAGGAETGSGFSFELSSVDIDGQELMISSYAIPAEMIRSPSVILAGVPSSLIGATSTRVLLAGLILTLMVAALAALLGLFLARNISRPLRQLTEAAAAGIEGDLGMEVDITSKDEVGGLAESFALMRERLRKYIAQLEDSHRQLLRALSYTGDILAATTDRRQLVKITAETAQLATDVAGVWIYLRPQQQPPGQESWEGGAPDPFFNGERRRRARELSAQVATLEVGEYRLVDFDENHQAIPHLLSYHGQKILGVMLAVFERGRAPEQSQRRILSSLSIQAASAIENVDFSKLQQFLAITDPLTGLLNYRFLAEFLEREISKSRRYHHDLSLAMVDLDDFKQVNDAYGHETGNQVLRAVAAALSQRVRASDLVARFGGEEFTVVFPETSRKDAVRVAEELRAAIAAVKLTTHPDLTITASVGVAALTAEVNDEESLVDRADQALYRAKNSGKNRVKD